MYKKKDLACLFIIGICILGIMQVIQWRGGEQDQVKAETKVTSSISAVNFTTWSSPSLTEATEKITEFLNLQQTKSQVNPSEPARLFWKNSEWSEGSLMALRTVRDFVKTQEGLQADLLREQLIQMVHRLEPSRLTFTRKQYALNNLVDGNDDYGLEYELTAIGETEVATFDMVFVLDWSSSMNNGITGTTILNSRTHAKDMIQAMATKLVNDQADARIRIIGTYSTAIGPNNGSVYIANDTGFFPTSDSNASYKIDHAFDVAPSVNDDVPGFVTTTTDLITMGTDKVRRDATPIMFMFSDFQLNWGVRGAALAKQRYVDALEYYYRGVSATSSGPLYFSIGYQHRGTNAINGNGQQYAIHYGNDVINKYAGWGSLTLNGTNGNGATQAFTALVDSAMKVEEWQSQSTAHNNLEFVQGSFKPWTSSNVLNEWQLKSLKFSGNSLNPVSTGTFKMTYKKANQTTYKKGDVISSMASSTVGVKGQVASPYQFMSRVVVPVTDIGIEHYVYQGTGGTADPANYSLVNSVVSSNYNHFSGEGGYPLTSPGLASYSYGRQANKLQKDEAITLLKKALGPTEAGKYAFDGGNLPTIEDMTAEMDSSQNVYKIYSVASQKVEFCFKLERTAEELKLVEIAANDLMDKKYESVEFRLPKNTGLKNWGNMSLPTKWDKFENSGTENYDSFTFAMNGANSWNTIKSFLDEIRFTVGSPVDEPGEIQIIFREKVYTSYVDENNLTHYYTFIPELLDWTVAYGAAKEKTYKGLTGYLATVTNEKEHDFIYENIAKEPGWLGGTRLTKTNNSKVVDEAVFPEAFVQNTEWYWASGPEAGVVYFDKSTRASGGKAIGYDGWKLPVEPNNSRGVETVMQFAYGSKYWNDIENTSRHPQGNKGYYVEFSQYGNQIETELDELDVHCEAAIPQKVYIKGKDDQANDLLAGDQVLETELRIGKELTFVPTAISGYAYLNLEKIDGTVVAPQIVTIGNTKHELLANYTRTLAKLHVRQVITQPEATLVAPVQGEGKVINTEIMGGLGRRNLPIVYPTHRENVAGFKEILYEVKAEDPYYLLEPIIPEYYEYFGYALTPFKMAHTAGKSPLDKPEWDINEAPEIWLTIFLKPALQNGELPGFYGWSYGISDTYTFKP